MRAGELDGHALFAWLEGDAIQGTVADDGAPTRLATIHRAPFIALRASAEGLSMLLFASSPHVEAFELRCDPSD